MIARVRQGSSADYQRVVQSSRQAFESWSVVAPPTRGEIIRQVADELRTHRDDLGHLVKQR